MATLREIRKRLRSAQQIKQITRAMEMVAAARLRRAQHKVDHSRPYAKGIKHIFELLSLDPEEAMHPLFEKREVKKTGLIVIAADRGLCGSYNTNVFQAAHRFLEPYQPKNVELILIGRKAVDHFARKKWKIRDRLVDWGGKITHRQIRKLTYHLINDFLHGELDQIWVVYTEYLTFTNRKVRTEKFLNLEQVHSKKQEQVNNYIFEPNVNDIFNEILPRYCVTKVQTYLEEAYASELAARIISMKSATSNAQEMIENLTLVRNKVRQASITKEMLEITSSAEGLK